MSKARWGILGTANIARAQFLPGLREAGGTAAAVAGRDAGRAERYASDNGVEVEIVGGLTTSDQVIVRASSPVEEGTPVTVNK